jgi:two-component system glycerol uptake and utilization response regulator
MSDAKTILIIDDSKLNIDILLGMLSGYDIVVALDGLSGIEIAVREKIDLILLDILMPEMDGFQTCQALKRDERSRHIPIIFITARNDEDSLEQAYDIGGIDYVTKPFKPKEVLARVKTQLQVRSLIDRLERLSSYDQMTGIYNRRKFFELAKARFTDDRQHIYAMMLDIDHFKAINDRHGHPVGDRVIRAVAQKISDKLEGQEVILGRLGGEEFAILADFTSLELARQQGETLRHSIENLNISTDDDDPLSVTISVGIARARPHQRQLDELLKEADDALYEAKGSGRNRAIFRG